MGYPNDGWASEAGDVGKGKGKTWNTWTLPQHTNNNNNKLDSWDSNKLVPPVLQGGAPIVRPGFSGPATWQSCGSGSSNKGGGKNNSWGVKGPSGFTPPGKGSGPPVMMPAPRLPGYTGPQAGASQSVAQTKAGFMAPPPPPQPAAPKPVVAIAPKPAGGLPMDPRAAATQIASALVRGGVLQPPSSYRPPAGASLQGPGAAAQYLRPPTQLGMAGTLPALGPLGVAVVPLRPPSQIGAPAQLALPGLAPDVAALALAGQAQLLAPVDIKKPRIFLLLTRLSPDLQEGHMQQILEQCGEVCGWRRGRDASGAPLSFGFVQLGSAEAAWKASTCLSGRKLCGQEVKVLVEEHAEGLINKWRAGQQAALKLASPEELEFELERIAVSCKALIDAKVEEIWGPEACDGAAGAAAAQRRKELRDREARRVERVRKRKAWREAEFDKELLAVESEEKRLRTVEREKDAVDREKEEEELKEKSEQEIAVAKMEEAGIAPSAAMRHPEGRKLVELVNRVQAESREDLFKMEIDMNFLRNEKILENKMRPWLESKIDLFMGGCQSDLVEYILRRVNGNSTPEALISDLSRYLDDHTDQLVERMWRMMGFELMCHGLAPNFLKKEK